MEVRKALQIMKDDFDENVGEEGYKEEFAEVLEAESVLIQFTSAILGEPCDIKYNWEKRNEDSGDCEFCIYRILRR